MTGAPPFGTSPFGAGLAKLGQLELAKVGLAKVGQIFLVKVGLAKVGFGQSRSDKDGQSRIGQSRFRPLLCGCCVVVVWLLCGCCVVVVWLLCGCCGVVVVLLWCGCCGVVVVVWLLLWLLLLF